MVEDFVGTEVREIWKNSPVRKAVVQRAAKLSADKESRHWGKLSFPLHPLLVKSYSATEGASIETAGSPTKGKSCEAGRRSVLSARYFMGWTMASRIFAQGALSLNVIAPSDAR